MTKLVECVPNFSEGRNQNVMDSIRDAAATISGVTVLDCEGDWNHNRMVLTFVGSPESVKTAALASSGEAIRLIDLRTHRGEHPRMGAVDVVPFVPLTDTTMEECITLAKEFASELSEAHNLPVFLYERAATREERRNLAAVREGQFEGLSALIGKDPARDPDYGPKLIHPSAGATAVGARPILIAFNVDLQSEDVSIAKKIARKVRERDGGLACVRALGFELKDRGLVQVSMNLTDYTKTSIHEAFDAVSIYAKDLHVEVAESEIVGLTPLEAISLASSHYLKLRNFKADQIIENRLLGIAEVTPSAVSDISFAEMSLANFAQRVSSDSAVPGGGTVSAYAGALSASLVAMVCRLTIQKKGYETVQQRIKEILGEALQLQSSLFAAVDSDAKAYDRVASAQKLPKESEGRREKISEALKEATEIPAMVLESSHFVLKLARELIQIGNKNASSDAETAIVLSAASMKGALANININLESLRGSEEEFVRNISQRVDSILSKDGQFHEA